MGFEGPFLSKGPKIQFLFSVALWGKRKFINLRSGGIKLGSSKDPRITTDLSIIKLVWKFGVRNN